MAQARLIYRAETTDSTLNELTFAHIISFNRLVTHADDWGRFYGDAALWKAQLFPRQPYMTLDLILAIQHDLAAAELVGFWEADSEEWCVLYKFAEYQQLKKDRLGRPMAPCPPEAMLHMMVHPKNAGKSYDPPDLPYRNYQRAIAQNSPDQRVWEPSEPRPPIEFVIDEANPLGAVMRTNGHSAARQSSLLEADPAWADDVERAAGILLAIPKFPGKRLASGNLREKTLELVNRMKGKYPHLNIEEVCDGYSTWCMQNALTNKKNAFAQVQNRFKIQEQIRTGTYRQREQNIPGSGRVEL